jgi:hypothetical protein
MLHRAIAATAVSLLTLSAPASEPVAPNTLLTERDKLLLADDLDHPLAT